MTSSQFPFSSFICQLVIQWRESAVITGPDIFKKLEAAEIESLNLPVIKSSSMNIGWARDAANNIMVAKENGHFRSEAGWYQTSAREKVAADLAPPGLPIAPVLIWERTSPGRESTYYSISPRLFPDSRDAPSDAMLMADFILAKISVFDQWIFNIDRHKGQIIHGTPTEDAAADKAGVDHGISNFGTPDEVLPLLYNPPDRNSKYIIPGHVRNLVREQIDSAPEVKAVIEDIRQTSDIYILHVIERLPDKFFPPPDTKQRMAYRVLHRRDHLNKLVRQGAGLN